MRRTFAAALGLLFLSAPALATESKGAAFFDAKVKPTFDRKCSMCHRPEPDLSPISKEHVLRALISKHRKNGSHSMRVNGYVFHQGLLNSLGFPLTRDEVTTFADWLDLETPNLPETGDGTSHVTESQAKDVAPDADAPSSQSAQPPSSSSGSAAK